MVKKVCIYILVAVVLIASSYFAGSKVTEHRLMEQHRLELELARERANVLTDTITRAREEVGAIGESLSRQRTNTTELRELIGEVRRRYEAMENLLYSIGLDYDNTSDDNSGSAGNNGEQ